MQKIDMQTLAKNLVNILPAFQVDSMMNILKVNVNKYPIGWTDKRILYEIIRTGEYHKIEEE